MCQVCLSHIPRAQTLGLASTSWPAMKLTAQENELMNRMHIHQSLTHSIDNKQLGDHHERFTDD